MQKKDKEIKDSVRLFYNQYPQAEYGALEKLELVKKIRGKNVLDAGCGAGYFLFDYLLAGASVTGIDQSAKSIEFIREQSRILGFNPTLIVADLEEVELPDNSFDYISCIYVLHHTPHPEIVLKKFGKWCKKDGEIYLIISHKYSPDTLFRVLMEKVVKIIPITKMLPMELKQRIHWWDRFEHPYWNPYSKKEVLKMCENSGLEVKKIYCQGFTRILTALIPPILIRLFTKLFSSSIGKAVIVEARPRK